MNKKKKEGNSYKDPIINHHEEKNINLEKQAYTFVTIMLVILFIVIFIFFVKQDSNNFKYKGIEFNKNYLGSVTFYTAKIPVKDNSGNVLEYLFIDFRNDPRKLGYNDIELNSPITFQTNKPVYISYDNMNLCEDNGIAAANFGLFLNSLELNINGTLLNKTLAQESRIGYATCQDFPENTVIEIRTGDINQITRPNKNCYTITIKECDILKVLEQFELKILEQVISN